MSTVFSISYLSTYTMVWCTVCMQHLMHKQNHQHCKQVTHHLVCAVGFFWRTGLACYNWALPYTQSKSLHCLLLTCSAATGCVRVCTPDHHVSSRLILGRRTLISCVAIHTVSKWKTTHHKAESVVIGKVASYCYHVKLRTTGLTEVTTSLHASQMHLTCWTS